METLIQSQKIDIIINVIRVYLLSAFSYYLATKNLNNTKNTKCKKIIIYMSIFAISIICGSIRWLNSYINSTIILIFLLSIIFSVNTKNDMGYSLCIMTIYLSVSYVLYFIATTITFIPVAILNVNNDYLVFAILGLLYIVTIYLFLKMKRFNKGFIFLQKKLANDYINILILNISITIIFSIIILTDYNNKIINGKIFFAIVVLSIIMFVTIQKSLKLYYKQKMLVKDLNETKEELENKKKEVEELEKENLNFSKISHSIAHKQKALEYKLNTLMVNSEVGAELDLKDRLEDITKELKQETVIELGKTDIPEIDDMLAYMQSECVKSKIDFQLQLSGNIHHMVNNYIDKDKLEILLADLIKNAIIAINYSENTNKSILVRLGIIEGIYSLYVYDSGIEFELETLENLGIKPSTTHGDNGGTGMGMMNTFDTLKQYKASMIIHEYGKPSKDNFTKLIQIAFDNKNEFKISSYRQDKINKL